MEIFKATTKIYVGDKFLEAIDELIVKKSIYYHRFCYGKNWSH